MRFTHRKRLGWASSILCFLAVALATSSSSSACTYSYDPKEVTHDFSVEITVHGMGIADLHLQVHESAVSTKNSKLEVEAITDDHGIAWFRLPRPGAFRISTKNVELTPDEEIILKRTSSKGALQKIVIQLPQRVLAVRSISGSIHGHTRTADPVNYEALVDFGAGVKLTLIRARSEEIVESHVANDAGEFSFSALPEGLYFLHVEAPAEPTMHRRAISEYVPVSIDPLAKMPNLDLYMSPGICVDFGYRNGDET